MEDEQSPERAISKIRHLVRVNLDDSIDRVPQPKGEFKNLFQGTPPKDGGGGKGSEDKGNSTK